MNSLKKSLLLLPFLFSTSAWASKVNSLDAVRSQIEKDCGVQVKMGAAINFYKPLFQSCSAEIRDSIGSMVTPTEKVPLEISLDQISSGVLNKACVVECMKPSREESEQAQRELDRAKLGEINKVEYLKRYKPELYRLRQLTNTPTPKIAL